MDISKSYLEFKVLFNFFDFFRVAFSLVLKLLVTNICLRFYTRENAMKYKSKQSKGVAFRGHSGIEVRKTDFCLYSVT